MSQAIVDPAELRRFAQSLKRFHLELQTQLSGIHGQMLALGDTWRDQEQQRFAEEFEQTLAVLERFMAHGGGRTSRSCSARPSASKNTCRRSNTPRGVTSWHFQGPISNRSKDSAIGTRRFRGFRAKRSRRSRPSANRSVPPTPSSPSSSTCGGTASRLAEEELTQATAELRNRRFPDATGRMPDCALQERNVRRAEAKIEYIDERIKMCRRWGSHLEREIREVYEAGGVRFAAFLEGEVVQGLNRLQAQIRSIELYLNPAPPSGGNA